MPALIVLICFLPANSSPTQLKQVRKVLLIDDLGIVSSPGFAEVDQAVFTALQNSSYQIELYHESLQLTFFPDEVSRLAFSESLLHKYAARKPDLIIAAGSASLQLLAESPETFIRETPVIFCGVLDDVPDQMRSGLHLTGILGRLQPENTLETALRLFPDTKHVVVIGGVGKFDEPWEHIAKQAFQGYDSKLDFTYLTNLTMPALLERIGHLPSHTIVYHTSIAQDAAGGRFIGAAQSVPLVANAANVPVFVMDDVDLKATTEHGAIVGGAVVNWMDDGRMAGDLAVRLLNGERPEDVPIQVSNSVYMFDWRALKRWGIKESSLPGGSIVLNRQPTFWELYKRYVLIGIFVFLAQTAAILGLLWQRRRRRNTEAELRKSEEKFSKAFRQSPFSITIARISDGRYVEVNETFELQTGWKRDEAIGRSPLDLGLWIDPSQRSAFLSQLSANGDVKDFEVKWRRKNGQIRTTLGSAELIEVHGEPCALSVIADITERKQAEEAMAGFSRRLIEAQETERTRIARELHDDINQRLAMVAISLKAAKQGLPISEAKTSRILDEAGEKVSELENDVQALSHRLHSSKLEYLGLEAAASGFCRELSERQQVRVDFRCDDIPEDLSSEVSLCLFRVLQEALHNAVKYSGVDSFDVSVTGVSDAIVLKVHDSGTGFDAKRSSNGHGLGLTSMRERLKLVGGELSIDSAPEQGTTIVARVPLLEQSTNAGAAA